MTSAAEVCRLKQTLERQWNKVDQLGQGTFGAVFKASMRGYGGAVAVKVMARTAGHDQSANEIKILRQFGGNSNVIDLLKCDKVDNLAIIYMELLESDDFKTFLYTAQAEEIIDYIRNLLVAVKYLHQNGIVHRDIKPKNFLFRMKKKPRKYRLIDFGLSALIQDQSSSTKHQDENADNKVPTKRATKRKIIMRDSSFENLRRVEPYSKSSRLSACSCLGKPQHCRVCDKRPQPDFLLVGTRGYKAPEVIWHFENHSTPVDVFACGMLFAGLLAQKEPFISPTDDTMATQYLRQLYGDRTISVAMDHCGKKYTFDDAHKQPGIDLAYYCTALRADEQLRLEMERQALYGSSSLNLERKKSSASSCMTSNSKSTPLSKPALSCTKRLQGPLKKFDRSRKKLADDGPVKFLEEEPVGERVTVCKHCERYYEENLLCFCRRSEKRSYWNEKIWRSFTEAQLESCFVLLWRMVDCNFVERITAQRALEQLDKLYEEFNA